VSLQARSARQIVALGGGHGLSATLTALRLLGTDPTAVVTMADDGGSSGRLRRDLGIPPPGDLRMALLALADQEAEPRELFGYRFQRGDLAGHSLGNLMLAGLAELRGNFLEALEVASRWLRVHGRVLPSTLVPVRLRGRVEGQVVEGQVAIRDAWGQVERVWLEPRRPAAMAEAVEAVRAADLVLLGPGSIFTSVVPNLLVPELGDAIAAVFARVAYVCNLEPQPGESSGFSPEAHLAALLAHCPGLRVPVVLCQRPASQAAMQREIAAFAQLGARVLHAELADPAHPGRHDPTRLAVALKELG
jgi:uncharacterized cofD-like protein